MNNMIKRKIKKYGMENHNDSSLASSLNIPHKSSTSLFESSMTNRPVARFWEDKDKDGVMNGFDCEPRNKRKQGLMHNREIDRMTDNFIDWKIEKLKEKRKDIDDQSNRFMSKKERIAKIADEESIAFIARQRRLSI